jgi:hypothetical protein
MSVIGMFVALTQVDFMIIRIVADLVVNSHTTYYFLRNKEVDVDRYDTWKCANNTRCQATSELHKFVEHDTEEEEGSTHGLWAAGDAAEETAAHRPSRNVPIRTTHDAMLHSALWCCATSLDRIQHSVHSKSLALKCTEHSVLSK